MNQRPNKVGRQINFGQPVEERMVDRMCVFSLGHDGP